MILIPAPSFLDFSTGETPESCHRFDQFRHAPHQLAVSLVNVNPELGDQGVGRSKLRQREDRHGELTDAYQADAELRQGEHAAGELPYRNDPPGGDRNAVCPVLERDMQERHAQQRSPGLVFKTPPVPLLLCGKRRSTLRTRRGLFGHLVPAFTTRFHSLPFCHASTMGTRPARVSPQKPDRLFFKCMVRRVVERYRRIVLQ